MLHKEKITHSFLTKIFRHPLDIEQLENAFVKPCIETQAQMENKRRGKSKKAQVAKRAKKVFHVLRKSVSEDGTCQISYNQLISKTGYCKATVIKAVKELCELGWVEKHTVKDNGGHQANIYILLK